MVSDRASVFYMCIPWGNTFSSVPRGRSSVKVKYEAHNFKKNCHCGGIYVLETSCSVCHGGIVLHDSYGLLDKMDFLDPK